MGQSARRPHFIASSLDSRDSPALELLRDQQVHMSIGTSRVASREEMGLPRQKNCNEIAQTHGDAPGLVADPNDLADPMTDVRIHGAEAFAHSTPKTTPSHTSFVFVCAYMCKRTGTCVCLCWHVSFPVVRKNLIWNILKRCQVLTDSA